MPVKVSCELPGTSCFTAGPLCPLKGMKNPVSILVPHLERGFDGSRRHRGEIDQIYTVHTVVGTGREREVGTGMERGGNGY